MKRNIKKMALAAMLKPLSVGPKEVQWSSEAAMNASSSGVIS